MIDDELRAIPPIVDGELALYATVMKPGDPTVGRVPAYELDIVVGGMRVGRCDMRLGVTEHLVRYGGQIGYGIEPAHRGHHYAARAVRLLLGFARDRGMREVWITCNPDNLASRRTCERAGGELGEIVELPADTDLYEQGERQKCRYRFVL